MRVVPSALALLLFAVPALSACSGAGELADLILEEAERANQPDPEPDGEASGGLESAVFVVENDTDGDLCDVHISDFNDPDSDGYDLLETPLAPGESREFPYGSHADTDDHNLVATATACDGTEYQDYHFSYHLGAGTYRVHDYLEE